MLNSVVFMVRKGKKKSNLKANPRLLKFSVFSTHTPLLLFQAPRQWETLESSRLWETLEYVKEGFQILSHGNLIL